MEKFVLSVIGQDKPGILSCIATILFQYGCNIEDVSQTILQTEFASIFIVHNPQGHTLDEISKTLNLKLEPMGLSAHLRPMIIKQASNQRYVEHEPFVITTKGPDQPGTIAAVTTALASLNCNVVHFRAITTHEEDQDTMIMIFEVDVPKNVDHRFLRKHMQKTGAEYGLDISVQHRKIFETIHRV